MTTSKRLAIVLLVLLFAAGVYLHHFGLPAAVGRGAVQAVLVEDSAHRTPAIAAILASPEIQNTCTELHIAWHVIDQAETGPDLPEVQWALDAAKNKPLPALVIKTGDGKPQLRPATSVAAVLELLKRSGA